MLHDFRVWRLMDDGSSCLVMGCVVDEKLVFVAQPCPAWKSTRISTRVATRVTCKAGRCCPSQRTSTSRYQRATNSCFARACVMLPLTGPVPSRPARLFRVWWSCQAWPTQVTRPNDHRRSWTRGTAHHRSCSSPRPKSHRCQRLKRIERRRSFAIRATNALLTGSTRIAALMLYPSPMPVTPAVRFVSWAVCV